MTITDLDYPINLLNAIDVDGSNLFSRPFPPDLNGTLEYVLITFLSERSADIIRQRFKQGKTHTEIGKEYQLTNERIRQIEERALKELRRPQAIKLLQNGVNGTMKSAVDNAIEQVRSDELARAVEHLETFCSNKEYDEDDLPPLAVAWSKDLRVHSLSVRCYNALKHAGINTLGDLTKLTSRQLKRVRNLGKKCYDEVINLLERYGLKLLDEEETL